MEMLRCIQRPETDPYYNIAAEEHLLKTAVTDTFMIWRNEPAIIIGKHQNTAREINHKFIETHNLQVIRRITGGGTVYHDPGNINFSFIYTNRSENLIDFRFFTHPIILFLKDLGLNAAFEGKNNITVDGLKVSGNSAHIFRNKVLHHGTLLYNTDLMILNQAIAGRDAQYEDRSVRSVRANVTNISGLLKARMTITEFIDQFQVFIFSHFPSAYHDNLNGEEKESISKLAEEKYKKHDWNFGYSPEYKYVEEWAEHDGKYSLSIMVKEGVIQNCKITGPDNQSLLMKSISNQLTGIRHEKKSITERLKKHTFAEENELILVNQIIDHLF